MKVILSTLVMLTLALALTPAADADQRRFVAAPRAQSGATWFAAPSNRIIVQRQVSIAYPYYYYPGYYPQVLVISPYAPAYVLPPTVVATARYFCVLHNDGFISRVGLLDHLAGTHKIPLDAASSLCPDGAGSCLFPSY